MIYNKVVLVALSIFDSEVFSNINVHFSGHFGITLEQTSHPTNLRVRVRVRGLF